MDKKNVHLILNIHHEWINNSTFIALINELHAGKSPSRCRAHWSIDSIQQLTTGARRLYTLLTCKQNRMVHTRTGAEVCERARSISYRPAPAPASRHRPVAPLPELRRIVTRLDMPAPRRIDSAPSPRTPRHTVRTLNYHGAALVKLLCISLGLIDIFY